ncbi:STAS domain-containing protein [Leeia oryzae]|uniref:STAS domain-containing protein n=1 Tax=Leeia oryzae TaxID=356662 RepID=UPI0003823731|nr:STAS domain-containing protein [Leeia oryzae]
MTALTQTGNTFFLPEDSSLAVISKLASSLEQGLASLAGSSVELDCAKATKVDSATVSLLLHAKRLALRYNLPLKITSPSDALLQLVALYHVEEMLCLAP